MWLLLKKAERTLNGMEGECELWSARVALGSDPCGPKRREGDGRTPEGVYRICLVKEKGRYGRSLALSYPNAGDALAALEQGAIDDDMYEAICAAQREGRRPPWGTPLGGEIYLHEGGTETDWTQGCVALSSTDMARLFTQRDDIEYIQIVP